MNSRLRIILAGMILSCLLIIMVAPSLAQGAGEGGVIITDNTGGDPNTFNPLLSNDTVSSTVHSWMYPDIIGIDVRTLQIAPRIDPETGDVNPYVGQALADSWEWDESGTVLTLYLRQDAYWSDGTQITADDYLWAANAVKSGETSSPRTTVFARLDNGERAGGSVVDIEKVDDFTLRVTLGSVEFDEEGNVTNIVPNCIAISDLDDIAVVPSHIYEERFGSDYTLMDEDPFFVPSATFGPFTDPFFEAGVQVSLLAEENYPDALLGYVSPSEWVAENVGDTTIAYERFLAGDFTWTEIPQERQNEFRALAENQGYQVFEYGDNGYEYMAYNLADPENPRPGYDENGDPIDQGLHPVFGDKQVRIALAHAVDTQAMVGTAPNEETGEPASGILEGNGLQAVTHNSDISWVDPELEPYAYDLELAQEMLREAGWYDDDGDGLIECNDCLYAREVDPEYNGTPFEFTLITNAGANARERTGQTIRENLGQLGITVNFEAIDFGALVSTITAQRFDAVLIGWNLGIPFDPDGRWAFSATSDRPGAGFGITSYNNEELNELWEQATTLPGCDESERSELYRQAMRILYEDQPYMFLYSGNQMDAAQPYVEGWDPLPLVPTWNIDAWDATP